MQTCRRRQTKTVRDCCRQNDKYGENKSQSVSSWTVTSCQPHGFISERSTLLQITLQTKKTPLNCTVTKRTNNLLVLHHHHHHHHHHLPLNCGGCWCTTNDFTTSFLHFSLFSTALWDLVNSRPFHCSVLSFRAERDRARQNADNKRVRG